MLVVQVVSNHNAAKECSQLNNGEEDVELIIISPEGKRRRCAN